MDQSKPSDLVQATLDLLLLKILALELVNGFAVSQAAEAAQVSGPATGLKCRAESSTARRQERMVGFRRIPPKDTRTV
jgi:hypothetical protein